MKLFLVVTQIIMGHYLWQINSKIISIFNSQYFLILQEAYNICRTEVVQKMLQEIHHVATNDLYLGKTDKKTTDICRAYEILAVVANLKKPLDDDEKKELETQVIMVILSL